MPAFATASALPRQELALAVVEGENQIPALVGEKVLGPLPITWRNAHLVKATLADSLGLRDISADKYIHAPGASFSRLTATFGEATLTVTPRGVEIAVPNELMLDYRNRFDVMAFFSARFGNQFSGLTKEKLIAAQVFNTGNFSATNSTVAYTTGNLATISFIPDMIAAARRLKAAGEPPPYVAVMSGPVYERVRQAATVQAYTVGTLNPGQNADKAMILASLREYGIEDLLVGDSYYNNAADGAAPSLSQVWSNTYIFVGKPGMAGAPSGQAAGGVSVPLLSGIGANVFWEGYTPGGVPSVDKTTQEFDFSGGGGNYVESYPDLPTDSEIIRIKMSHKPTITNTRAGTLITTQYS
jgi:hypothetical protein